jgi:hypothetical protein
MQHSSKFIITYQLNNHKPIWFNKTDIDDTLANMLQHLCLAHNQSNSSQSTSKEPLSVTTKTSFVLY